MRGLAARVDGFFFSGKRGNVWEECVRVRRTRRGKQSEMSAEEDGDLDEPDIVTATTMEEVKRHVRHCRHFIAVADERVASQVLSKLSTLGMVRKASTITLLAVVVAYLAGRFAPDRTPDALRSTTGKIVKTGVAAAAVGTQVVVNSSPFYCYKIAYNRKGVLHLMRQDSFD